MRSPIGRAALARALALGLVLLVAGAWPVVAQVPDDPAVALEDQAVGSVPYVPVVHYWSWHRDLSIDDIRAAVEGRHPDFAEVLVAADDPAVLWEALDVTPGPKTKSARVERVGKALAKSRRTLGLVPAATVRPDVRALAIDGVSLFGGERIHDLASWPLTVPAAEEGSDVAFDPAATWTLAAAGDVMLDREVYRQSVLLGKGPDYPWNGGFAKITSRTCCTSEGGNAITTKRVGPRGAVRELLSGADIAVVNHEGPAPDDFTYHPSGLVFTFDPGLLAGVAKAGIDVVSLANNHIRNAGSKGVLQTMRNLRRAGIKSVGAGRDPERAGRARCLAQGDVEVCILAYNAVNNWANGVSKTRPGAAELDIGDVRSDIRRLRRSGVDVILVMPHWGREYVTSVTDQQRRWAKAMVRAGADVVLGAHSHVVGPMELIDGVPVLYSMGDFLFDLPRFEKTEQAFIAELTFHGPELAQAELHPTVIHDRSQVALLDPLGDGRVVLRRIRTASNRLD
jgi:poly-gamma-glutamate synthesis protein (capsule biosynthesis protein)